MTQEFNRVQISSDATFRLNQLKGNFDITPNYLCRIGLCYSLNEPRPPNPKEYDSDGKVFNRYTLLGEHDALYMAMVKERLLQEGKDPEEDLYKEFVAHLNRGVFHLYSRLDDPSDFYELLPGEIKDDTEVIRSDSLD